MNDLINHEHENAAYDAVSIALLETCELLAENERGDSFHASDFTGRNGSTRFEDEFLKPRIRKNHHLLHERINEKLSSVANDWEFVNLDAQENVSEADARSMSDMDLYLRSSQGEVIEVPINIKATAGKTADNVGGWAAIGHVFYGGNGKHIKRREEVKSKLALEEPDKGFHDYFLLTFDKNSTSAASLLRSATVNSILGSSLNAFKINMAQPFPLQFNSHQAQRVRFSEGYRIAQAQENLLNRLALAHIKHYVTNAEQWSTIATNRGIIAKEE